MVSVNDIFNRPPPISEDTLQYTLYLPPDQSDRVSATALATLLTNHANSLLPGHLWHRDSFELKVATDPEGAKDVWVLEGRMRVGDCIDDEWCTVWLLRELSRTWNITVSVFDSDGQFLLIEAADELPSWVTPTNAENRVWIHNSRLHLIPLSHVSPPSSKTRRGKYLPHAEDDEEANLNEDDESDFITASDAVKIVCDPLVDTFAPENVQAVVWKRLSGYPAASRQHMHVSKAYLPADVAKALAVNPLLVQKAVETFYTRDGLQLRAAQKMARFPPEPATLTSVKMTRTAYAQLLGQKFHPPKVFGRWTEREGSKEWKWRDVGMKIACGFEMLYQESKNRKETAAANFDGSSASVEAMKDSLRRNPDYTQYIQRLVSAGYFKGELEGSQLWTELENKAATAFVAARRDDDASRPSFASTVQAALNEYTEVRDSPSDEEDSDDWLNVDAADFDAMLEKTLSSKEKGKGRATDAMDVDPAEDPEDRIAKAQAERLRDLAQKVEEFVEGKGDVEGARFADEAFSDDEDSDDDSEIDIDDDNDDDSDADMHAEQAPRPPPSSQLSAEERATHKDAMDKLVPGIDPSEYGKMPPSFHSNSQRVTPVTVETDVREDVPPTDDTTNASDGPQPRPIRPPILPRDNFDGVDSDDDSDEDVASETDEEEERPQIVGEVEIDMAEEEDEFIEFARQALGISDEQWVLILEERSHRGAYIPTHTTLGSKQTSRTSMIASQGSANLSSFEEVMKAMDAELARNNRGESVAAANSPSVSRSEGKGKTKAVAEDYADMDIEAAMEAELLGSLTKGTEEGDDEGDADMMDYQLIKNFLESFKSQGGLSGPVGALVGRLQDGWTLPRDNS